MTDQGRLSRSRRSLLGAGVAAAAAALARVAVPESVRAGSYWGKYRGSVTNTQDPLVMGRIKALVPSISSSETGWAMPAVPYAGPQTGVLFLPDAGSNVWIEFESGDLNSPIWTGAYWGNGQAPQGSSTRRLVAGDSALVEIDSDGPQAGLHLSSSQGIHLQGRTFFSRSGLLTIAAGKPSVRLTGIALTSRSLVLAVLQQDRPGVFVRAVVRDAANSWFTIKLNAAVGSDTLVAWFLVN
jgi:hypothetical protein